MITQEYYSVSEISKLNDMTARNIRKIIAGLQNDKNKSLLYKDANNAWRIHHLLLPNFKRKRTKVKKYHAITIDPVESYSMDEIIERLSQVARMLDDSSLEFNIIIEQKAANGLNHIHGYYHTAKKRALMNGLKFWFPSMSYHVTEVYDLEGWINYMTKNGDELITITKKIENE